MSKLGCPGVKQTKQRHVDLLPLACACQTMKQYRHPSIARSRNLHSFCSLPMHLYFILCADSCLFMTIDFFSAYVTSLNIHTHDTYQRDVRQVSHVHCIGGRCQKARISGRMWLPSVSLSDGEIHQRTCDVFIGEIAAAGSRRGVCMHMYVCVYL